MTVTVLWQNNLNIISCDVLQVILHEFFVCVKVPLHYLIAVKQLMDTSEVIRDMVRFCGFQNFPFLFVVLDFVVSVVAALVAQCERLTG